MKNLLTTLFGRAPKTPSAATRRPRTQLQVEGLEDRLALSTSPTSLGALRGIIIEGSSGERAIIVEGSHTSGAIIVVGSR